MHMNAVHLFKVANENSFPSRDAATPVEAAKHLFAMARIVSMAAVAVATTRPNSIVRMREIADALADTRPDEHELALPLLNLVAPDNNKRAMHTRYFVWSAKAMGLLMFDDVSGNLDEISHPRLPNNALDSEGLGEDPHAVDTGDDDAPPTSDEPPATA
jgi:hypothetical protein